MMAKSLEKIESMVCEGLDQIAEKGELSNSNLDVVDKLTHTLKSIKAIESMGYKHAGVDIHTVLDGAQKGVKLADSMSVEDVRNMLNECIGKLGG